MITIDHRAYPHIVDAIWDGMDFAGIIVARRVCSEWCRRGNRRFQRHMEVHPHPEGLLLCVKDFREATETLQLPRFRVTRHMLVRTRPLHPLAVASESWLSELFANLKVLDWRWTQLSGIVEQTFRLLQQRLAPEAMVRIDVPYRAPRVQPALAIAGRTQVYTLDVGARQGLCTAHTDTVVLNLTCYTKARTPMCHGDRFKIWNLLDPAELGAVDLVLVFSHDTLLQMYPPDAPVFTRLYVDYLLMWLDDSWHSRTVTLVNAAEIWAEQWQRDMFKERFQERWAEEEKVLQQVAGPTDGVQGAPVHKGSLRLLSMWEYQDDVGSDTYWLQTLWDKSQLLPFTPDIMDPTRPEPVAF